MPVAVQPYRADQVPAVVAFNGAMDAGGADPDFRLPLEPLCTWLPHLDGRPVYNETYVALDEERVCGGYSLKHQSFSFSGTLHPIDYYHHTVSGGLVNRKYASVGVKLIQDALKRSPRLFALGMGGYDRPLPRMLVAMKWTHFLIPFYFLVTRPARFLREMRILQRTPALRVLSRAAASTGAGWVAIRGIHSAKAALHRRSGYSSAIVPEFGAWADDVWAACAPLHSMAAVRDRSVLNVLYPAPNPNYRRIQVTRDGAVAGWAVIGLGGKGAQEYGDLRTATILDCLARPEHADAVIQHAVRFLRSMSEVDLVLCNQSCEWWGAAMRRAGFLSGPSNFIFAGAPGLMGLFQQADPSGRAAMHLTRADGDGLMPYAYYRRAAAE